MTEPAFDMTHDCPVMRSAYAADETHVIEYVKKNHAPEKCTYAKAVKAAAEKAKAEKARNAA